MGDFHTGLYILQTGDLPRSLLMHVRKAEFVVSVWDGLRGNKDIARISGSQGMTPTLSSRAWTFHDLHCKRWPTELF